MSNNPDNPASLLEPYNCDATAGLRDRKQPQTKPYMMPNAIYGYERIQLEMGEGMGQQGNICDDRRMRTHYASISGDERPDEHLGEAG